MEKIIDVSSCNGDVEWGIVSKYVKFAILRATLKSGDNDTKFCENVKGCRAAGVGFDVYKYSYALTENASEKEAQRVVAALRDMECGSGVTVWWDLEDRTIRSKRNKQEITAQTLAAKKVILDAGYTFGVYCSKDWYLNVIDSAAMDERYWIARYPSTKKMYLPADPPERYRPTFCKNLVAWQYTSLGRIPGISGNVDFSILYV